MLTDADRDSLRTWAQAHGTGEPHNPQARAVLGLLAERDRLAAELARLRAVLTRIQQMAESDLRRDHAPDDSAVWQIEADARAALPAHTPGDTP